MGILNKCGVLLCLCLLLRVVCPDGEANGGLMCPTEPGVRCRPDNSGGLREHVYSVEGGRVIIQYVPGGYFSLQCTDNVTLGAHSLPRFSASLRVADVTLQGCPLVGADSYVAALARLNVTVLAKLALYNTPVDLPFRRSHFAALANLTDLVVEARRPAPEPEGGFLADLAGLRSLRLEGLRLRPQELDRLPTRLESLHLIRLGVERVSSAFLARLPLLRVLIVRDVITVEIELNETSSLRAVTLDAPGAAAPMAPSLERATFWRWGEPAPGPWTSCDRLDSLQVVLPAANTLPPEWVSRCKRMSNILVSYARLNDGTLPARLLKGATDLHEFNMTYCRLVSLPKELFKYTPKLRTINLTNNRLLTLPSEIFTSIGKLVNLDLSYNKLSKGAVPSVKWLRSLRQLSLAGNPVGDLCGGSSLVQTQELSDLHSLIALQQLSLSDTGVTHVCSDWRDTMLRLETLDLSNNNITYLTYEDLQFSREISRATVDMTGNAVATLEYKYADYYKVKIRSRPDSQAEVSLDSMLDCDCSVYWTAMALRERSAHVRVDGLACGAAGPLVAGPLVAGPLVAAPTELMLCEVRAGCPAGCRCWERPRLVASTGPDEAAPRRVVRVRCAGAGLVAPPPLLPAVGTDWELLLANNSIATLRREDLPADLLTVDLRNNSVRDLTAEATRSLVAARRVLLAGNPLACTCAAALPAALRLHRARLDYDALTCDEGGLLDAVAPTGEECGRRARLRLALGLAGGLAPAGLALAAVVAWVTRPELRLRVKAALAARGWLPRRGAEAEAADGRRYDVFVSHSHRDEAVAREVVAWLERAGYSVCVHYRDWAPGSWIPAQIAASVRGSRRTVVLVSRPYLASRWALAEFREAQAAALREARPTLVAVLVGEVPRALLDAQPDLRDHLDQNTYVEWGDPWFWEKLVYALPKLPRRRRGAPPPGSLAVDLAPAEAPLPMTAAA